MSTNLVNVVCEGGVCRLVDMPDVVSHAAGAVAEGATRVAQGYMGVDQFIGFLNGGDATAALPGSFALLPLFLVAAGLAMNLTPCVLPMIPVNLIVIGKSWRRGLVYGLGIALAYGALGVAAAVGGLAFGAIQGSPWFNAAVAVVFACLSMSLFGLFSVDFSRYRVAAQRNIGGTEKTALVFPFFMGALSAVLAGACVAPVLVSALLLTASLYADGHVLALALPFLLGVGMALPWPFLGAGMRVLPRPGVWMKSVNRGFAVIVLCFAAWYAYLSYRGFSAKPVESRMADAVEATPETFASALAAAKAPVLVDCWASWCKNCAAMESTTLSDAKVRDAMSRYTVIRLQAEDISALRRLSGFEKVTGLPAFVVFGKDAAK